MALSAKRKAFIEEYLKDLNGSQAVIRAGFSPKHADRTASTLKNVPEIAEAIKKAQEARSKRTEIDQDYILNKLKELLEKCSSGENWNPAAANKQCELLGKHLGMFTDKIEHSGTFENAPSLIVNVNAPK